jgi:excinuclease UvrABC ATPase subunit
LETRVRIKLEAITGKNTEIAALLNSGAESPESSIVIPTEIAEELRLNELKAETAYSEEATRYVEVKLYKKAVKGIIKNGEELTSVILDVVVAEGLIEPLLTDSAIDAFNIEIISFSKGLWRIRGESKVRESV